MVSTGTPETLERKIFFYRVDVGRDDGGRLLPFDPLPALTAIESLPFSDDDRGRYEFDADGNALSVRTQGTTSNAKLLFGRVRRNGLPQLEQAGSITDLVLATDEGLIEETHVAFFPKNIVGAVYNHFGPRVSRLGSFLHQRSREAVPRATYSQLLRADAAAQLDRLGDLRVLDFAITSSYLDVVRQADGSLADAFEASARLLESPKELSLVLKSERAGAGGFLNRMGGSLRALLNGGNVREGAERLKAHGYLKDTDRVDTIDLLNDQFIASKAIVRMNTRSRALDAVAAFRAIEETYQELRADLEAAVGISP